MGGALPCIVGFIVGGLNAELIHGLLGQFISKPKIVHHHLHFVVTDPVHHGRHGDAAVRALTHKEAAEVVQGQLLLGDSRCIRQSL